jgi:copper chaperone CopZ
MRPLVPLILLSLGTLLRAGDTTAPTQYTAVVAGLVCQNCKATVTEAMKKLPGVREVGFAKGEKPGQQKVTFAAASDKLTKDDAVRALAEHASEFEVLSFDKKR